MNEEDEYVNVMFFLFDIYLQGPAQAQNLRDSLVEAKSDIVVKVIPNSCVVFNTFVYFSD